MTTRLQGVIKRYGNGGFGFISSGDTEYYFHHSEIKPYRRPRAGFLVEFDSESVPGKSPRAVNIKVLA